MDSSVKLDPQTHQLFVNFFFFATFTCARFLLPSIVSLNIRVTSTAVTALSSPQVLLVY